MNFKRIDEMSLAIQSGDRTALLDLLYPPTGAHKPRTRDVSIYRLYDKRTDETKYIGATNQTLGRRLSNHLASPMRSTLRWIVEAGKINVGIEELDRCTEANRLRIEEEVILRHLDAGVPLLNAVYRG